MLVVPWQEIESDTLNALLEEYVTRDGTDYGEQEITMDQKVATLLAQLQRRLVFIVFDEVTEQLDILPAEQVPAESRQSPA